MNKKTPPQKRPPPKRPIVVLTCRLPDPIEKRMQELFDVRSSSDGTFMNHEQLHQAVRNADVVVSTLSDHIDASVIAEGGKSLRLIANFGMGVDHIDLTTARNQGITVTNTPDVLTEDTADITMALLLALPRRLFEGQKRILEGKWQGWSPTSMLGSRIWGKRLGIIGMGRIGSAVAKRAKGFGMAIHYHNRRRIDLETEKKLEAQYWDSLDDMLPHMDMISINCPHTPATFHLLSARRLNLISKHCYLVNTSRGEVIDQSTLIRMLANREIAGAGLDVYEFGSTLPPSLTDLDNVILLPHMGSATIEGRLSMGEKVITNITTFLDGKTPPDKVLDSMF